MPTILQPGIRAPEFTLPAVNLGQEVTVSNRSTHMTVLLFFGSEVTDIIAGQLAGYQERLSDFERHNAQVIAITDATPGDLRKLAQERNIEFPLAADSDPLRGVARSYGIVANEAILPAVFVVDQEGLIRRVYNPEPTMGLPNPAIVNRALINLVNTPKPPLMTADDWRLGYPEAPVALIEYGDYQCGHCQELYRVIMELLPTYGDKVQFVFRHFPLRHLHPLAVPAAEAAEAAGIQGKFWEMHARLFAADNALERENLIEYAREIGLDVEKFTADLETHRFEDAVKEDYRGATRNKIKSPPTLFINYILFDGPPTAKALRDRIDSLLACHT
ncbi:thioredoxin domain-containing protein [Moorella naiadis]|uniref:DsbA family protein n=1 Tax=Moorella naiadis (nom. illeg.) TaxID=3093670 RepID=UPI003D9CA09A